MGLKNVFFLSIDAADLQEYFADGEVDLLYLNFCDPWPRKKNAKRRLTFRTFLEKYKKILRPEGEIHFKTDNAPLFAVRGKTAFVSPAEACVEQELGLRAVEAAGLELEERPVMRDELPRFDELFYVDHRGVTALAHCDGHPCMAILAERVAQSLGGLFPKM